MKESHKRLRDSTENQSILMMGCFGKTRLKYKSQMGKQTQTLANTLALALPPHTIHTHTIEKILETNGEKERNKRNRRKNHIERTGARTHAEKLQICKLKLQMKNANEKSSTEQMKTKNKGNG